jgi:hypothetical protein
LDFDPKFEIFKICKYLYTGHCVQPIRDMDFTTKKYGVSVSFYYKLTFFGKTEGKHIRILSQNLKLLKSIQAYLWDYYV